MIGLSIVLAVTTALLRFVPDIALSRWVKTQLVERAATRLLRLERKDVLLVLVLVGMLFAGELVMMLGSADLVLAYAADLAVYGDTLIAVSTLAVVARLGSVTRVIMARLPRLGTEKSSRARRQRKPPRNLGSNDDNAGEPSLLAA